MIIKKAFLLLIFLFYAFQSLCAVDNLTQHFKKFGYVEIHDTDHGTATYDLLYTYFDEFIEFLQANPKWAHNLYSAKERFIRTQERLYYSTDFFGFYDELQTRGQIAFYYSIHFHEFMCTYYKKLTDIPAIIQFFDACREIQKSYGHIFIQAATELGLEEIFSSSYNQPPILFKVVKYVPSYVATRPHYDGTAFSLLLDSTDNESLLLSPYKSTFTIDDFSSPVRTLSPLYNGNSILLIPGTLLKEFSIDPTPHIVTQKGITRYATIAFAMRPHYIPEKSEFSPLPSFQH